MAKTVHALLVGIDKYQPPVPPLHGCTNDIEAIHQFLQSRLDTTDSKLEVLKLLDKEATRDNVINGFREHLSKAGAGDVALFYYSGHGAYETAAEEFWPIEPDHLNETLVCYDSRTTAWDLADKELSQLISELSAKEPHILVVLDCCHSGSGTRAAVGIEDQGFRVRRAPTDTRKRPLNTYLFSPDQIKTFGSTRDSKSDWLAVGQGQHVLMAACRPDQTAKEARIEGKQRGAFSAALLEALEQPGSLSYRDLFKRVENQIKNSVNEQNPQLELLVGQSDELFLGGAVPERPAYFTVRHQPGGWTIDGGAIHRIPPVSAKQPTRLAVYAVGSDAKTLADLSKALGTARVSEVKPDSSGVDLKFNGGKPDSKSNYWAIVTEMAVQPLRVALQGDRQAVDRVGRKLKDSLYATENSIKPEYRILAKDGAYWITLPGSDRPLSAELVGYTDQNAASVGERLEHIARWRTTKDLTNPTSMVAGKIQMTVYEAGTNKVLENDARLTQTVSNGKPVYPAIKVKIKNNSADVLYCSLLSLSESFAVDPLLQVNNSVERLEPGQELELNQGKPMRFAVPDDLWKIGITERSDILKLIVSTEDFDADLLRLSKLDFPTRRETTRSLSRNHPLQQLMRKVGTRDAIIEEPQQYADWCTQSFSLTIVRPQASANIDPNQEIAVGAEGAKIKVKPHKQLKAKVGVSTKAEATRSLEGFNLPPILRDYPELVQPIQFSSTRGSGGALEVFELTEIENPQAVTPENPLELELPTPLDSSTQQIIPLAIHKDENGTEYYLPLGFAATARAGDGGATVKIEHLPNLPQVSTEERRRSLFNSLRMMFLKIAGEKLGVEVKNQLLSVVEVSADGTPNYIGDMGEVKERVAALQPGENVLLYVHGILGKTKDIVGTVVSTPLGVNQPISQHYKLILAYDYENLNTSIKDTGKRLRQMLIEAGLGPNHGKNLSIVAHSMGGLVSRWFIEHQGGAQDQMVQRLVMLGTPNGGSPWLNLKEWVTHLLTLAVNGLAPVAWVKAILNGVVALLRATTTTSEMKLNSPFIQELGTSLAAGVKYAFIAGDASLQGSKERQSFISKLMDLALHTASQQLFQGKPNDLAASVESVLLPSSEPKPQPIGCDHFSYFVPEVGLGSLAKVLE